MMAMRSEHEMIAYALEADTALLPYLPELLADLEELGGNAEAISKIAYPGGGRRCREPRTAQAGT